MKRWAVLGLTASLLVLGAPVTAHASHADYRGECHLFVRRDPGTDHWKGAVWLYVVATDSSPNKVPTPTAPVTASCELKINGASQGTVLGPVTGTGAVADADELEFDADDDDQVSLCDHVTVDGEATTQCGVAMRVGASLPGPVRDLLRVVHDVLCLVSSATCDLVTISASFDEYMVK